MITGTQIWNFTYEMTAMKTAIYSPEINKTSQKQKYYILTNI